MKYLITENRLFKVIDKFVDSQLPQLRDVEIEKKYDYQKGHYADLFLIPNTNKALFLYWKFNPYNYDKTDDSLYPEIQLQDEIFHLFTDMFGEENLSQIFHWFNITFDLEAESITF